MKTIIIKTKPISVNSLYYGVKRITKEGKDTKTTMAWEVKSQYRGKPLQCDIGLDIDFFVPNQLSDLDNLLKGTLDCLTGILWDDDRQIIEIMARKYVDKKNPRIEILINQL